MRKILFYYSILISRNLNQSNFKWTVMDGSNLRVCDYGFQPGYKHLLVLHKKNACYGKLNVYLKLNFNLVYTSKCFLTYLGVKINSNKNSYEREMTSFCTSSSYSKASHARIHKVIFSWARTIWQSAIRSEPPIKA